MTFPECIRHPILKFDGNPNSPVFYSLELACAFVSYSWASGHTIIPRSLQPSNKLVSVTNLKKQTKKKQALRENLLVDETMLNI